MKYTKLALLLTGAAALLTGCGNDTGSGPNVLSILLVFLAVALLALALLRTYSVIQYNRRPTRNGRKRRSRKLDPMTIGMFVLAVLLIFGAMLSS